jgi:hypothetical protein
MSLDASNVIASRSERLGSPVRVAHVASLWGPFARGTCERAHAVRCGPRGVASGVSRAQQQGGFPSWPKLLWECLTGNATSVPNGPGTRGPSVFSRINPAVQQVVR